jgi:hypothetical protein
VEEDLLDVGFNVVVDIVSSMPSTRDTVSVLTVNVQALSPLIVDP